MTDLITRPDCIVDTGLPDLGIYVACLASYNGGILRGQWIDLSDVTDAEEIQTAIDWMLQESPAPNAEEYAVHDSCGLPGFLRSTEWPDLAQLALYAETLADLSADDAEPYRIACDDAADVIDEDAFRDTYCGHYDSGEDYAQQFQEDCGTDLGPLANYIDWERYWRDLTYECHSEEPAEGGGVYIFRSC